MTLCYLMCTEKEKKTLREQHVCITEPYWLGDHTLIHCIQKKNMHKRT